MSDTPRTDAEAISGSDPLSYLDEKGRRCTTWQFVTVEFARTLERQNTELLAALKFAREEIASFPRSFAYDVTHLPRIDEAIRRAEA